MSPPISVGSSDSSYASTSLWFSLACTHRAISFSFLCLLQAFSALFFFLATIASFRAACRAAPFGPLRRCGRDL